MKADRLAFCGLTACTLLSLSACGNGPEATVGGNVTGLASGASVTLTENDAANLSVGANGTFELPTAVKADQPYTVAVQSQPAGQLCTVGNASGMVDRNGDPVDNVTVICTNTASVGGSVTGLATNTTLTLSDSLSILPLAANGTFTFTDGFAVGATYAVAVSGQPLGQTCNVSNGDGSIDAGADSITTVAVVCAPDQTVAGTVSGLAAAEGGVTLSDGTSSMAVGTNGLFNFADLLPANSAYTVSVVAQPQGEQCAVANGTGTIDATGDAVTNVSVNCTVDGTLSGTLTGLATGAAVVLSDGTNNLSVAANNSFMLPDVFAAGTAYAVSVATQPAGETCIVTNGSGAIDASDDAVTNVGVNCTVNGSLGGTVAGLAVGAAVVLSDGTSKLPVTANGPFALPDAFGAGASYAVSVVTQPAGQTCVINNGSGKIDTNDDAVAGVTVSCS